jgi:hypothetical protein
MDNGNSRPEVVRGVDGGTQNITIKCAPGTQKISIDMDCLSMDVALSLLERAHRELEARFRFQRAQELLLEAHENQRLAAIAGDVASGRRQ